MHLIRRGLLGAAFALAATVAAAQPADSNRLFKDSKIVVRDRFSDEIVGKGPDVVFIPGLASSRATWKATAERLRGRYRLHLIQIAGFAGEPSRANAQGEVFRPTIEAIDAYIVEQKLTPATLVGHSLGGSMVIYLAEIHPDHLKRGLVVDSLPFLAQTMLGPQATAQSAGAMAKGIGDNMAKGGEGYAQGVRANVARMVASVAGKETVTGWGMLTDPSVAGRAFAELLVLDQRPGLAGIRAPLTVLYPDNVSIGAPAGAMDAFYPAAFAPVPKITLKRVDASLHFIMIDQPALFAEALEAFLKD
jgi:pimeloyl-[acyl-carrier protein] methyl ester esterase